MQALLPNEEDFEKFNKIIHTPPRNFVRCNTLKISPNELTKRLKEKWQISQPYPKHPEIILIDQELKPGELGNSIEHLLGYYYIQEISSMLSPIALNPQPEEFILDLCASPGSKTTQIASYMDNQGTLIANDVRIDRIKILSSNLEKAGVTNTIITRRDGVALCEKLSKFNSARQQNRETILQIDSEKSRQMRAESKTFHTTQFKFDRILLDAPCSGEGTLRSSPKTFLMWNPKVIKKLSGEQKKLLANALKCLKVGGTLVYSTCTHAPEENEEVVDFALKNFPVKIEPISLPLKTRPGITSWNTIQFNPEVSKACRIYPQDNDSEGFFVSKFTLLEEIKE
jgi:16S rRNA C967 or C1407 C5-methylase (RsmB/RsmF family)